MNGLELERLTVRFGGLTAVDALDLAVAEGTIHGLIGPNGAGKTTVINAMTGIYPAAAGSIRFRGRPILGLRPDRISRAGIARSFQNTEIFPEMTAFENVLVGAHRHADYGPVAAVLRTPRFRRQEKLVAERSEALLDAVGLGRDRDVLAASLPFGKQRLLELARALASSPTLLLLDEPAAGLRAAEIDDLNRALVRLRGQFGLTILLVDHVMRVVMNVSDRITVLNFGRKIAEGTPEAVRADADVRRAYLGDHAGRARAS